MTTADTEVHHSSFNAGHVLVGDLRGFRVLKKLRADTLLFIKSFLEDSIVKALNEKFGTARQKKIRKGIHHFALSAEDHMKLIDTHSHYAINTDDQVPRLQDLLPKSLEKLTPCMTWVGGSSTTEPVSEGLPGRFSKPKRSLLKVGIHASRQRRLLSPVPVYQWTAS